MSTALIVVIVVAALILLALLFMLPRMRATAQRKKAERELESRRTAAAEEHRGLATERERNAEMAEHRARLAQQAAERERAEANLQSERAQMHERGMADDQLIEEHERDRFEGVGGTTGDPADRQTMDDRAATGRDEGEAATDYERGREDQKRFDRERITDDVRESEQR